jgi:hypothetical protein
MWGSGGGDPTEALLAPKEPNARLMAAAQRYLKLTFVPVNTADRFPIGYYTLDATSIALA